MRQGRRRVCTASQELLPLPVSCAKEYNITSTILKSLSGLLPTIRRQTIPQTIQWRIVQPSKLLDMFPLNPNTYTAMRKFVSTNYYRLPFEIIKQKLYTTNGSGLLDSSRTWFSRRITRLNLPPQTTSPLSVFIWPSCLWFKVSGWSKYGCSFGFFTASIFNNDSLYPLVLAQASYLPAVFRQTTSHSSKSPDGTNNINNGSYLFKCPGSHWWATLHHKWALGWDAAAFIITPVLYLLDMSKSLPGNSVECRQNTWKEYYWNNVYNNRQNVKFLNFSVNAKMKGKSKKCTHARIVNI